MSEMPDVKKLSQQDYNYLLEGIAIQNDKYRALKAENERLRAALQSIAKNSCCGSCQEAKLVAIKALEGI